MKFELVEKETIRIEKEMMKKCLTVTEVSQYLGVSVETINDMIESNELAASPQGLITSVNLATWFIYGKNQNPLDDTLSVAVTSPRFIINDICEEEFEMARREKGLGSVYYNEKRKCWQAAFYMIENGEKKRKIISSKSQDEAIITMSNIRAGGIAFTEEKDIPTKAQEKHKIIDIWEYILENKRKPKCKPRTYKWYADIGKHFKGDFGNKYIEDLTSDDIQEFLNHLKTYTVKNKKGNVITKFYCDKTIKEINGQLKKICAYSSSKSVGYVKDNPYDTEVIERPRGVKNDPRDTVLSMDLAKQLMKATLGNMKLKTVVYSLLITGIRIGEFLSLRWSDIDRENNTISIFTAVSPTYDCDEEGNFTLTEYIQGDTKTRAGKRVIPVHPNLFKVLDNWRAYIESYRKDVKELGDDYDSEFVFSNYTGNIRSYQSLRSDFYEFLDKNGLGGKKITFHCLRRTLASKMRSAGVETAVIAAFLGHESKDHLVTNLHYTDTEMEPKIAAAKAYYEKMKEVFEIAQ